MADDLTEQAWLLKSKVNPFPVGGQMVLSGGRFTFTLGKLAESAVLGWVEEATGETGLKERLAAGEDVRVIDRSLDEIKVTWPKMYAGSALQVEEPDGGRTWIIALDYPSGGSLSQTISLFTGRKKGKLWKAALRS